MCIPYNPVLETTGIPQPFLSVPASPGIPISYGLGSSRSLVSCGDHEKPQTHWTGEIPSLGACCLFSLPEGSRPQALNLGDGFHFPSALLTTVLLWDCSHDFAGICTVSPRMPNKSCSDLLSFGVHSLWVLALGRGSACRAFFPAGSWGVVPSDYFRKFSFH